MSVPSFRRAARFDQRGGGVGGGEKKKAKVSFDCPLKTERRNTHCMRVPKVTSRARLQFTGG